MTRVHPIQARVFRDHRDQAQAAWYLGLGVRDLFFHPGCDCIARNAKGPLDATQTAAFVKCVENLCATFIGIAIWRGVLATLASTRTAAVALLAVRRPTITHKLIAPTVDAGHGHHPVYPLHISLDHRQRGYHILRDLATTLLCSSNAISSSGPSLNQIMFSTALKQPRVGSG